ncbi:MAG: hypothetical protein K9M45_01965 [Kiritimatiellales bacterium]|nr:hypothetical protein [Kiritimatiellales bacterium]
MQQFGYLISRTTLNLLLPVALLLCCGTVLADGPADNIPDAVRRIPPQGIDVPEKDRMKLRAGLDKLAAAMARVKDDALLPDVEIFHKAVRYALEYDEFQKTAELKYAAGQLEEGLKRAAALKAGDAPWTRQTGLVVRGFRSKIDGSVQPYGLVIPDDYRFDGSRKHRLDFWFHGRGERSCEVGFIQQRMTQPGQYTPESTIVLHPYARYSNANKFAGEVDCLEALEQVMAGYRVDPGKILVRGFSMGGAACWQFAVHYADRWCAANPGAGFAETQEFLKGFQGETLNPAPFERKLWHLYDCTDYALNLYNLPTVAYSGEIDSQKQAADIMALALAREGMTLTHIIGPGTAHKIHPDSKIEIENRLAAIVERDRGFPASIKLVTYTLRYNRMHWFTIDRLGEHWAAARVEAEVLSPRKIRISECSNITRFTLSFPAGKSPLEPGPPPQVEIMGKRIPSTAPVHADHSWKATFALGDTGWSETGTAACGLWKRHGLQGPVDDALMDSFLFVTPGSGTFGKPFDRWAATEQARAVTHWRQQFRGDARVKSADEITADDIANHHLVLWGNPASNPLLARMAGQLPISWTADRIIVGDQSFDARTHGLIMIYPNPLNPVRYMVLNSGFTYREYDYLNNARQIPKLPDWAVIDLTEPPGTQRPGRIAAAGFFDEQWQLRP